MAMNNHMEARRRQMFMERVCAARKRLELAESQQTQACDGALKTYISQSDPLINTESGPSKTARPLHQKESSQVVFEKVVHDPNFYYRSAVAIGENPPIHVNPVYKLIYPGAYTEPFRVNEEGHKNRYRSRQHLTPHCDKAYSVMYTNSENVDYVLPETRKKIRENISFDKYEISCKVNGKYHFEGLQAFAVEDTENKEATLTQAIV